MPKPRSIRTAPAAILPTSPSASFCRAGFRQPAGIPPRDGDSFAGARRPAHRPRPRGLFGRRADRVLQAAAAPCRAVGLHDHGPAAQAARTGDRAARGERAQRRRALRPPKVRFRRPRSGRRDAAPSAHDPAERQPGVVGERGLGNAPAACDPARNLLCAGGAAGWQALCLALGQAGHDGVRPRPLRLPSLGRQWHATQAPRRPAHAGSRRTGAARVQRPPARSARLEAGSAAHWRRPPCCRRRRPRSRARSAGPTPPRMPCTAPRPPRPLGGASKRQMPCQARSHPRPSPIRAPARTAARPPRRAFRRRRAPLPRQARSAQRQARGLLQRRAQPTGAARSGSAMPGMPGLVAGRGALPCVAGLHSRRTAGFGPPPETSP